MGPFDTNKYVFKVKADKSAIVAVVIAAVLFGVKVKKK